MVVVSKQMASPGTVLPLIKVDAMPSVWVLDGTENAHIQQKIGPANRYFFAAFLAPAGSFKQRIDHRADILILLFEKRIFAQILSPNGSLFLSMNTIIGTENGIFAGNCK